MTSDYGDETEQIDEIIGMANDFFVKEDRMSKEEREKEIIEMKEELNKMKKQLQK